MTADTGSSLSLEDFTKEVQAFLEANVNPEMKYFRDVQKMSLEQYEMHRDLMRALGSRGWLYPTRPVEYGGGGLDGARAGVIYRELAKRRLSPPIVDDWTTLATPAILACGTEEQKLRFLPPMLRGEALTWQLFTEPEAGTDVANIQIAAGRDPKDPAYFIVNGQKIFVGGIHPPPQQFFLIANTDPDARRHENLSGFIVPADLPGVTIQPLDLFVISTLDAVSGMTGAVAEGQKNSVFFDDVRIHESCLIGSEGEGWNVIQATFAVEHGGGFARAGAKAAGEKKTMSKEAQREAEKAARERQWTSGRRNFLIERFFDQCRNNPSIVKRLKESPNLVEDLVNVFVFQQTERLFSIRNGNGVGNAAYAGPLTTLFQKNGGADLTRNMASVLGPHAMADDEKWILDEGIHEVAQRCGICQAPGGTPEAMKIIISRALSIGR